MYGDYKMLVLQDYPEAKLIRTYKKEDGFNMWTVISDNPGKYLGSSSISQEDAWRKAAEYVGE